MFIYFYFFQNKRMYFHYKNTYVCFERLRDYKKIGSHNSNIRRQYMQKFIRTPKYIKFSRLLASSSTPTYFKKCYFPHNILQIQKKKALAEKLRSSAEILVDVLQGKANWLFVCVRNQKSWDFLHRKKKVSLWDLAEMG